MIPRAVLRVAAALLWALATHAFAARVDIVLSEDGAAYAQAAEQIRREIGNRATVQAMTVEAWDTGRTPRADLVVTLGARAFGAALSASTGSPVLATLLPRVAYDRALRSARTFDAKLASAVWLDQPAARQIALVRFALPDRSRIGVLRGPETEELVTGLRTAARDQRFAFTEEAAATSSDIHPALLRLAPEADALIAVPDASVFNAATIPNILIATYRLQLPVFGFSAAYVRAGALAAVYSTPTQVARQAGDVAARVLASGTLPPAQYSRAFTVAVNSTVARSLGLSIDDEATLAAKLTRAERE